MALRECQVTFRDMSGISHSVTVLGETALEAAALALKRITDQNFIPEEFCDPITVELVTSTQHTVSMKKVVSWMANDGGRSPKEVTAKRRVRES